MKTADLHTFAAAIFTAPARTAPTLADKVDRIGQLKAEIAEREAEINDLRATLEDAGLPAIDGHAYRVTFSTSTRTSTDWKRGYDNKPPHTWESPTANDFCTKYQRGRAMAEIIETQTQKA